MTATSSYRAPPSTALRTGVGCGPVIRVEPTLLALPLLLARALDRLLCLGCILVTGESEDGGELPAHGLGDQERNVHAGIGDPFRHVAAETRAVVAFGEQTGNRRRRQPGGLRRRGCLLAA